MTTERYSETERTSLAELLKALRDETSLLLRQEVALAKTELTEKAVRTGRNLASLLGGSLVAFTGLIFLLLAVTAGIFVLMQKAGMVSASYWAAPLIVGAIAGVVGWVLIQKALESLKHESPVPEKTVESLKENKTWIEQRAH